MGERQCSCNLLDPLRLIHAVRHREHGGAAAVCAMVCKHHTKSRKSYNHIADAPAAPQTCLHMRYYRKKARSPPKLSYFTSFPPLTGGCQQQAALTPIVPTDASRARTATPRAPTHHALAPASGASNARPQEGREKAADHYSGLPQATEGASS